MDSDYQHVLLRLREERERWNLTQRLLCYYMKMRQSHFSKSETGHRYFSYHELEGLCTSDVDVLYMFTGKKSGNPWELPGSSEISPEEMICYLSTLYNLTSTAWFMNRNKTSFEKIQQQLEYIRCGSGNTGVKNNIFLYVRNHYGYTQKKLAGILGMDIKKLRDLEKGRLLPDSEIIWKMYIRFQISPAYILKDPRGLRNELNYILNLLEDSDREIVLQILANEHKLIQCDQGQAGIPR